MNKLLHLLFSVVPVFFLSVNASDSMNSPGSPNTEHPLIATSNTEHLESIPDYFQRDGAFGGFPQGGSMYCGPTAASNAIIQLSKSSTDPLYEQTGDKKRDQHNLIRLLGSNKYFNTGKDGSGPAEICKGLSRYFSESGIDNVTIRHFGWRKVPSQFQSNISKPELDSAHRALSNNAAVLVNFGWYEYDKKKDIYTRKSGHWVTMAGYGHNGKKVDPDYLIIHDPETSWKLNDYLKLEPISSGKLEGEVIGLPVDAAGYHRFPNGFGKFGIIDGFIVIELPPQSTPIT